MGQVFLSGNYVFFNLHYQNYRYTDARSGCTLHYLALLVKGTAKFVYKDRTLEIKQGDVFYIPKGLQYQSYWYGEPDIQFLSFGFSTIPTADQKNYILQTIPSPASLPDLLMQIPTPGSHVDSYTLSLFYNALAKAIPHMTVEPTESGGGLVSEAMVYMRQHPNAQIPEVASACGISQPHLYALFRQIAETTPNDYRQSILCQTAIELLATTSKTVEEISNLLHFSSASYFRKVLRKHTGRTPKQIRQDYIF